MGGRAFARGLCRRGVRRRVVRRRVPLTEFDAGAQRAEVRQAKGAEDRVVPEREGEDQIGLAAVPRVCLLLLLRFSQIFGYLLLQFGQRWGEVPRILLRCGRECQVGMAGT